MKKKKSKKKVKRKSHKGFSDVSKLAVAFGAAFTIAWITYESLSAYLNTEKEPTPQYKLTQEVLYNVPRFFRLVCSGEGEIAGYSIVEGEVYYDIRTSNEEKDCPTYLKLKESDILFLARVAE